jgi:hypothetical protein
MFTYKVSMFGSLVLTAPQHVFVHGFTSQSWQNYVTVQRNQQTLQKLVIFVVVVNLAL